MINPHTKSRIEVVNNISNARLLILAVRSNICLNEFDVKKIDDVLLNLEYLVNKVMKVVEVGK